MACLNPTKGWIGHLATAARVKYPAALQRCKFDTPLLVAGSLIYEEDSYLYLLGLRKGNAGLWEEIKRYYH